MRNPVWLPDDEEPDEDSDDDDDVDVLFDEVVVVSLLETIVDKPPGPMVLVGPPLVVAAGATELALLVGTLAVNAV